MNIIRNPRLITCTFFVVIFSTLTAYYRAFISLAPYDDEGAMMLTLKPFFDGRSLYDQVPTFYGPVYYLYQFCAHKWTGTPISHHSVRLVSITFWVAAAILVFLLAYRITGSLLLAFVTHLLSFRAMGFIGEEPAHPQEACIFLLTALGLACFARNRTWRFAMLGVITGLLVLTKINLGIFAIIALATGFAYSLRPKWLRTVAFGVASAGMLLFPVLLMSGSLPAIWALKYCALVILSAASALVITSGVDPEIHVDFRDLFVFSVSFAAALAALCWFALAHGSTLPAMIDWLVIRPRATFGQVWSKPAPVLRPAPLWALIGLALACFVRSGRVPTTFLACAKATFGVVVIAMCFTSGYEILFNFAPPLLWLVAAPSAKSDSATHDNWARTLLLLLSVLQVLYAYPIAGSQIRFATVLMIAIAIICLSDGIEELSVSWSEGTLFHIMRARQVRWAAFLFLGLYYVNLVWQSEGVYDSFEPLGFPGTRAMRLAPQRAADLRALVAKVNASSCRTLITEPGLFSFNLFTGKPAPASFNAEGWVISLSPAEQERIIREVAEDPDTCVILCPKMVDLWTGHRDVSSQPLVRYIRQNFRSDLEVTDYSFLVRRTDQ